MVRAAFCRPLSINNTHTPHGAKRPRLSLWESWQPERADLSARRRYASEQPPQAALSESQRGCRTGYRKLSNYGFFNRGLE